MLSNAGPSRLGAGTLGRTAAYSINRSSALRGAYPVSRRSGDSADNVVGSFSAQYMAAASISSTLRSRTLLGLPPSIALSPLQSRLQLRAITTETQRPTQSSAPPLPLDSKATGTKVATAPPLQAAPPTPPLPISSIPPKIQEVAAEKAQDKLAKREDKPKKGFPARAWAKVKEEASHYWHGTKLLGQEIKISAKLQYKVLQGSTLTRRERRQVGLCAMQELVQAHGV